MGYPNRPSTGLGVGDAAYFLTGDCVVTEDPSVSQHVGTNASSSVGNLSRLRRCGCSEWGAYPISSPPIPPRWFGVATAGITGENLKDTAQFIEILRTAYFLPFLKTHQPHYKISICREYEPIAQASRPLDSAAPALARAKFTCASPKRLGLKQNTHGYA